MSWMVEYETKRGVRDDSKWKDSVAITWDAEVREEHVLGEKNQELCFGHVEISINPSGDFGKAVDKWNWSSGESWRWRWTFGSCQHVERRVDRENKRSKDWAFFKSYQRMFHQKGVNREKRNIHDVELGTLDTGSRISYWQQRRLQNYRSHE